LIWVSRAMALWLALVALSLLWMVARMFLDKKLTRWVKFLWVLASLFLGPAAILIQVLIARSTKAAQVSPWKVAWGAAALVSSGYAAGWAVAISLLISSGDSPHPLLTLGLSYFIPLLVGLVFVRIPLGSAVVPGGGWRILARSLLVEAFTLNLGFACFFPLTMLVTERLLTTMPGPSSPLFWAVISWVAVCGVIVLLPLNYWMSRRGYSLPSGLADDHTGEGSLPTRSTSWLIFGITFVLAVAALAVTIG